MVKELQWWWPNEIVIWKVKKKRREWKRETETEQTHKNARTYSHFYDLNVPDLFFLSNWNSVAEQSFVLCHILPAIFGVTFQFLWIFPFCFVSLPFLLLHDICFVFLRKQIREFQSNFVSDFLGLLHSVNKYYDFLTSFVCRIVVNCRHREIAKSPSRLREKNCQNAHKMCRPDFLFSYRVS